jgi:hypothetical protein
MIVVFNVTKRVKPLQKRPLQKIKKAIPTMMDMTILIMHK